MSLRFKKIIYHTKNVKRNFLYQICSKQAKNGTSNFSIFLPTPIKKKVCLKQANLD